MILLELLAIFVHGVVAMGNALGIIFNLAKRNWLWTAIHALGLTVHLYATREHIKDLQQ